jgi:hypothetical protein
VTSSDFDGSYAMSLAPGTYTAARGDARFAPIDREITVGVPPCDTTRRDSRCRWPLGRRAAAPASAAASAAAPATAPAAGCTGANAPQSAKRAGGQCAGRAADAAAAVARGGGPPRFQTSPHRAAVADGAGTPRPRPDVVDPYRRSGGASAAAGFFCDAPGRVVAVSGTIVEVDRAQMLDRLQALGRGEFGMAEGQQFSLAQAIGGGAGDGQIGAAWSRWTRRSGRRRPGGFGATRRPRRRRESPAGERELQRRRTPSRRGALRAQWQRPQARDYLQQSFSTTLRRPVKIPHLYNGTNRTTFNFSYSGGRNGDLFDQYATVPSAAFRAGDFSASSVRSSIPRPGCRFRTTEFRRTASAPRRSR